MGSLSHQSEEYLAPCLFEAARTTFAVFEYFFRGVVEIAVAQAHLQDYSFKLGAE